MLWTLDSKPSCSSCCCDVRQKLLVPQSCDEVRRVTEVSVSSVGVSRSGVRGEEANEGQIYFMVRSSSGGQGQHLVIRG